MTLFSLFSRLALALAALMGAWLLWPALRDNVAHRQALLALDIPQRSHSVDETAWEEGWRSLCPTAVTGDRETAVPNPFTALALLDRGDYPRAARQFAALPPAEYANAPAYTAALELDWLAAARLYQPEPTPRHQRWWGTIFYLAAQQLLFRGERDAAADWYRRADAAYGIHGPYISFALVDCLEQAGRMTEAFDAYRRALLTLPPQAALAHLERFQALRLAGLEQWQLEDSANERLSRWLALYRPERETVLDARALAAAPQPMVQLAWDLANGQKLLGFDYRPEDIETGPFMTVVFYLQEGQGEAATYRQVTRTVLNQAANGAFAWDAPPDGVRPFGWHQYVYTPDARAVVWENGRFAQPWLCLDAGRLGASFGLQSVTAPLGEGVLYVQGGQLYAVGEASLSLGRRWSGVVDPYNYSYVGGRPQPHQLLPMVGMWERVAGAAGVAVWLLSHQTSNGCFYGLYLFELPL